MFSRLVFTPPYVNLLSSLLVVPAHDAKRAFTQLFYSNVCWHVSVVRLWAATYVFSALFLQPDVRGSLTRSPARVGFRSIHRQVFLDLFSPQLSLAVVVFLRSFHYLKSSSSVFSGLIFTALAITLVLNKQPVSPFFGCFFSPTTLFTMSSRFTAKLKPSHAFFLSHGHVLLVFSFVHAAPQDGVGACLREILVFSCLLHS